MSRPIGWRKGRIAALCIAATMTAGLISESSPAHGARGLDTGLMAGEFGSGDAGVRGTWLDRAVDAQTDTVRLGASWRGITAAQPADPRDPGDPAYDFGRLDEVVRDADARGLRIMLTVSGAPDYAEGANRPSGVRPGAWKPDPRELGRFARALALRYSGTFDPDGAGGEPALPRVRFFQDWNEPNLDTYLAPQWKGKRPYAPLHYRRMTRGFYAGVKSVHRSNRVITAGTAPFGEPRGGDRMRPLLFWRKVFCLKNDLRPAKGCRRPAALDALAHHPISTSGGPRRSAIHDDDATVPDLRFVRRTLRRAERAGHVVPGGRRPLWVTEFWWESNPPDRFFGVRTARHARYIEEALYLMWKQRVRTAIYFLIRDPVFDPDNPGATVETGLYFRDPDRPKPALRAFRFPFVAEPAGRRRARVWGRAPEAGPLVVERRTRGGWRAVRRARISGPGEVFSGAIRARSKQRLRARTRGDRSLVWRLR